MNSISNPLFLGFDTIYYPGDRVMAAWKKHSPYGFVGYYLKAPCRRDGTFRGKRRFLLDSGWGLAVVYVGRQAQGPCSSSPLNFPAGAAHGIDAVEQVDSEGFGPGAAVYLDVEYMDRLGPAMSEYVRGWFSEVVKSPFRPAIYCHVSNAASLRKLVQEGYPTNRPQPLFWVAGGRKAFDSAVSCPEDSGVPFASIWQGKLNTPETYAGSRLLIDVNVSRLPDPSGNF